MFNHQLHRMENICTFYWERVCSKLALDLMGHWKATFMPWIPNFAKRKMAGSAFVAYVPHFGLTLPLKKIFISFHFFSFQNSLFYKKISKRSNETTFIVNTESLAISCEFKIFFASKMCHMILFCLFIINYCSFPQLRFKSQCHQTKMDKIVFCSLMKIHWMPFVRWKM